MIAELSDDTRRRLALRMFDQEAKLHETAVTARDAVDRQHAADELKAVRQLLALIHEADMEVAMRKAAAR